MITSSNRPDDRRKGRERRDFPRNSQDRRQLQDRRLVALEDVELERRRWGRAAG